MNSMGSINYGGEEGGDRFYLNHDPTIQWATHIDLVGTHETIQHRTDLRQREIVTEEVMDLE